MSEKPILFSGPMVRAILEGRKRQTRRIVKPIREWAALHTVMKYRMPHVADPWAVWWHYPETDRVGHLAECPYGKPGGLLWVRETWAWPGEEFMMYRANPDDAALYEESRRKHADNPNYPLIRWSPSIYMPRRVCRITLEITEVRAEQLQAISDKDARQEGMESCTPADQFRVLWDSINGKTHPWASNPWVWVISFRRLGAA